MKLLVTGGAGFIGSNFVKYMLKKYKNINIINLDKLTYAGNKNNLIELKKDKRHKLVKGDILNKRLVNKLVKKVDLIVHFAAESHVDNSINNREVFIKTNVYGTLNLLNTALKHNKRFHHISTDEVFGSLRLKTKKKFNEESPYKPNSIYSASKASSDHLVRAFNKTYGLPTTISNCSNNYGPYQHPEKLIPLIITNLLRGKGIPIYGNGMNIRDWLHVDDHCRAIDLIINKGRIGETYCIGANNEKTNLKIAKLIIKEMGLSNELIHFVKDRPGHDLRYAINSNKIKKELKWKPKKDFKRGIKETINWYKNNEWWWKKLKK